ncbi:MAG: hypothetical protein R2791_20135 [Saprospiraceae bacterium]
MKHLILLLLSTILLGISCTKDKTDSPFIGTFKGSYKEKTAVSSITLDDVSATVVDNSNNKLNVKLNLDVAGTTLNATVLTDTEIFFPPQDYFGEEVSGSGVLSDSARTLTIEMELTSGTPKTFTFTGTRQ